MAASSTSGSISARWREQSKRLILRTAMSSDLQLLAHRLESHFRAASADRTRAFHEGRVFILDEASQLVAALVGTGSRLLDCCAAPGGKTQALAARNPSAEIIAAELHSHRAELLRKRVHAANVKVIQGDALHLPTSGGFDRVLADVPCSGTGTLARNPEIKWRLTPEDLDDLHQRQVAILRAALGPACSRRSRAVFHVLAGARGERSSDRGSAARLQRI